MSRAEIAVTLREGDAIRWEVYREMTKAQQLAWRLNVGHREFVRLQRLHFHAFI